MKLIKMKKGKQIRTVHLNKVAELEKQGWKKDGKIIDVKVKTIPVKKAINKKPTAPAVKEK